MPVRLLLKLLIPGYLFLTLCSADNKTSGDPLNLDFEAKDSLQHPSGWMTGSAGYHYVLDNQVKHHGNYSLSLGRENNAAHFGTVTREIGVPAGGDTIVLKGFLKTSDVNDGFAGLWLREDDELGQTLAFDNMANRGVKGTSDWKEYSIRLPLSGDANTIFIGALVVGPGRLWVDQLQLEVDGKPYDIRSLKPYAKPRTASDPEILAASVSLSSSALKKDEIHRLSNLAEIWGFLKYYRPHTGLPKTDWDSVLFNSIPALMKARNSHSADIVFESLVAAASSGEENGNSLPPSTAPIASVALQTKSQPDFGHLFQTGNFSPHLMSRLDMIRRNPGNGKNKFVEADRNDNPSFAFENLYGNDPYPNTAIRLLALFRYWNIIQYYYPYRLLLKDSWNSILPEFIPRFVSAANKEAYVRTFTKLIGRVHDSHADIWGNAVLDAMKGDFLIPFKASFVKKKLVVTGFFSQRPDVKSVLRTGDIIIRIDGVPTDSLVRKWLPLTPASNYVTQLRNMTSPDGFLLRSPQQTIVAAVFRDGKIIDIPLRTMSKSLSGENIFVIDKPAYSLTGDIGYINPSRLKESDFDSLRKKLGSAKGIVIDLRCYPSVFMPFTYGSWLKSFVSPFVKFTSIDFREPGKIVFREGASNGATEGQHYRGKLIILVNSITQSQAEYTTMAFQSVPGAIVVGSQTAGADGNVSQITLPGQIRTAISGLGVYYPDGGETQRTGVRIDVPAEPTIEGIRQGRDELLEKAIGIIHGGKSLL